METQQVVTPRKDEILKAFQQLLSARAQKGSTIATKQEALERQEDKKIVEQASTYSVESIVKGLADLQLNFGKTVEGLATQLSVEAPKLEELRRAIRVETRHAEELRNIKIAADALDILIQEHRETTTAFEQQSQQECQALDEEISDKKLAWQKAQEIFESEQEEYRKQVKKEREQREADYVYSIERKRKIEADNYANQKSALERQIAEEESNRTADWAEREEILKKEQETFEHNSILAESFSQKLEGAVLQARKDASNKIYEEANVTSELFEKELAADKEVYELKISSLQETVELQNGQIQDLAEQLQTALKQVQYLAVKAVESKSNKD